MRFFFFTCSAALLLLPRLASAQLAPAPPKPPRLETEYKLVVPAGQETSLWTWLRTAYAPTKLKELGTRWGSSTGVETFEDRYYDDEHRALLTARAGLRHRRRFEHDTLKKQMVQLKVTDDEGGLLREEKKHPVQKGAPATGELAQLLAPAEYQRLAAELAPLHVQLNEVHLKMTLCQRRRRLYFSQDGQAFSTITIDSSYVVGTKAHFTEVEIELNEIRYSAATLTERQQMEKMLTALRDDLLRAYPGLQQDQRPKYTKMAALL